LEPVQPPDAVHEVALVDDHDRLDVPPDATCVGFAVIETVGIGGVALTTTLAVCEIEPPAPEQLKV
jgi:hypothetical protein